MKNFNIIKCITNCTRSKSATRFVRMSGIKGNTNYSCYRFSTEYALVLALISIGLIAVLIVFRDAIGRVFDRVVGVLDAAPEGGFQPSN